EEGAPEHHGEGARVAVAARAPCAAGRGGAADAELGGAAAPHPGGAPGGDRLLPTSHPGRPMTAGHRSRAVPLARAALAALLVIASVPGLAAQPRPQRDPLSRAFELERRGATAAAAEAYLEALTARPSDLAALLGLERALVTLGRPAEVLPPLRAALKIGRAP